MTNSRPLVSVITPAFNSAATLRRAHESLRQQRENWQHIIVNDGSTDATAEIIASLSADSRVIGASRENGGPGAALNTGIRLACGDYIAFLDADDEYYPNHLEARLAVMERRRQVDILWSGVELIAASVEDRFVPDVARGFGRIHLSECVVQGTIFARRRVFETMSFSEDRRRIWYQDYDFMERARRTCTVEKVALNTYRYYRGRGNSVVDAAKRNWPMKATLY